jgi:hypothetical protein
MKAYEKFRERKAENIPVGLPSSNDSAAASISRTEGLHLSGYPSRGGYDSGSVRKTPQNAQIGTWGISIDRAALGSILASNLC